MTRPTATTSNANSTSTPVVHGIAELTIAEAGKSAQQNIVALFISDIHLQADMPATTAAFLHFLQFHAVHTKQLYLLGDIFEYWAGDDDLSSPYPQKIALQLRILSDSGVAIFWIAGNRDFLVGTQFAKATKVTLLNDPCTLHYAGQRYAISHGDQLCSDDVRYQAFRHQVRQPDWQSAFLAKPLAERKAIITSMRMQSQQHQQEHMQGSTESIMDVNLLAVDDLFTHTGAHTLIHGHTHRPALHRHAQLQRYVLPDWNCDQQPARGGWLALLKDGSMQRYNHAGIPVD